MTLPEKSAIELAITRQLRSATVDGKCDSALITDDPEAAADKVMSVVRPVLDDRDAEIELLRSRLAALEDAP